MKCCNAYENKNMKKVMGQTLRPGGFRLTDKGVQFCNFSAEDSILDLGCGMGATVNYLYEKYGIKAVGIDPSQKLIDIAREKYSYANFILGIGEKIPLEDESFQGIFAECTLSLMSDLNSTIREVFRLLKNNGWFVITDVYARNPSYINELNQFSFNSCVRGLHDLNLLTERLEKQGFKIILQEDCTNLLKELLVKIIFSYGSMGIFWNKTTECTVDGYKFEEMLRNCKPGYFIMIARKGDKYCE